MDDNYVSRDLRSRLITAGISEIESHGVADFSLRRVAAACSASCAAPYRHFENKSTFILEIIKYINSRWELLQEQIEEVYCGDEIRLATELSMALISFRLANPEFHAVLSLDANSLDEEQRIQLSRMTEKILLHTKNGCAERFPEQTEEKCFVIQSLIFGAVILCDGETPEKRVASLNTVRSCITKLFAE